MLFSFKEERYCDIRYKMDESWRHCAKWNKSVKKDKNCVIPLYEALRIFRVTLSTESRKWSTFPFPKGKSIEINPSFFVGWKSCRISGLAFQTSTFQFSCVYISVKIQIPRVWSQRFWFSRSGWSLWFWQPACLGLYIKEQMSQQY